jgi:hypothetical protein
LYITRGWGTERRLIEAGRGAKSINSFHETEPLLCFQNHAVVALDERGHCCSQAKHVSAALDAVIRLMRSHPLIRVDLLLLHLDELSFAHPP